MWPLIQNTRTMLRSNSCAYECDEHGADAGKIKRQGLMQVPKNDIDKQIKK